MQMHGTIGEQGVECGLLAGLFEVGNDLDMS
jgi:hypothetical protein